jgi:hypothetical protein
MMTVVILGRAKIILYVRNRDLGTTRLENARASYILHLLL